MLWPINYILLDIIFIIPVILLLYFIVSSPRIIKYIPFKSFEKDFKDSNAKTISLFISVMIVTYAEFWLFIISIFNTF